MSLFETLYLTLNGDTADFDRAIKASSKHVVKLTESVNKANNSASKLGSSLNKASGGADKFILSLVNSLKVALNVTISLNKVGKSSDELAPRFNKVGRATLRFIKELEKLSGKATKSVNDLHRLGKEFFSLNNAMDLLFSSAKNAIVLGQLAEQIGINVSTLDAWRRAINVSGGDADVFTDTLKKLSKTFDDPIGELLRYSDALSRLSQVEAQAMGKKLGLDEGTIELLRQGRTGVEGLLEKQQAQGVVNDEQVKKANELMTAMANLENVFESVKQKISSALIPIILKALKGFDKFVDWINENGFLVSTFIETIAALMLYFGLANLAAMWPLLALAVAVFAIIAVFKLAYDAISDFLQTSEFIQAFCQLWDNLWAGISEGWDNLWKSLKEGWETLKGWLSWVPGFGDSNVKAKVEYGTPEPPPSLEQLPYLEMPSGIEFYGSDAHQGYLNDPTFGGKNHLSQISTSPITTMTASSISNKNWQAPGDTKYVFGDIEIHTAATDASGIAKGFTGEMQSIIAQNDNRLLA